MSFIRFVLQPNKIVVPNQTVARWIIPLSSNYTNKSNLICDRANEDNCGSCGNGLLTNNPDVNYHIINDKSRNIIFTNNNNIFKEEERYYFPFIL